MSKEALFLLIVVAVVVMMVSMRQNKQKESKTDTFENLEQETTQPQVQKLTNRQVCFDGPSSPSEPASNYVEPDSSFYDRKFSNRDKAAPGEMKASSFRDGKRSSTPTTDWTSYFEETNNLLGKQDPSNFMPMDDMNGQGCAAFKSTAKATCGSNPVCSPDEVFDVDKYLPQEVNDDWFDIVPEPISVKNRHLINISNPIGINTIGSSLRNASYDIRAEPKNPQYVVSPWLQSTIQPSDNIKPLF